jgi:uncharacterized protein YgbK (DUF1537 family)
LDDRRDSEIARAATAVEAALARGDDAVVFTSRDVARGATPEASLAIGERISQALCELVSRLHTAPRFLIAKGGITSSDLATRGLGMRRALVLGPLLPGVPVWRLGAETRFPRLTYAVFPGNVGGPDALATALLRLRAGTGEAC